MAEEKKKSESHKSSSFAEARVQVDLQDVSTLYGVTVSFPDPNNIRNFIVQIVPERGIWKKGKFKFSFHIPKEFPFKRPKVTCMTRIWHPNIEETGSVCLNILRDTYTAAVGLSHLIAGLQFLFDEPNPDSPLNQEAATQYKTNLSAFTNRAREYILKYCE